MKEVLKKVGVVLLKVLVAPFMIIYLVGLKIVQGVKFVVNKIK